MRGRAPAAAGVLVAACSLAACGGSGRPGVLGRGAVAVTNDFTRLAWNEHGCRAARRYLANGQLCASMRLTGMIPAWSQFLLTTHRIRRTGCRLLLMPSRRSSAQSPGCIEYTARSGFLLLYGLTRTSQGWRIAEIGVRGGPGTSAPRLDRRAVAVTDAFTRLAWNKHDCLAGRRFLLPGLAGDVCPPNPTGIFPLKSHHVRPNSCGHGNWNGGYRISPGCIDYTASDGSTLEYDLTKTPMGWRIIGVGTSTVTR